MGGRGEKDVLLTYDRDDLSETDWERVDEVCPGLHMNVYLSPEDLWSTEEDQRVPGFAPDLQLNSSQLSMTHVCMKDEGEGQNSATKMRENISFFPMSN